jgi:hypothetical protein
MATPQNVLDYLKNNMNNSIMRAESFFGDGTQDPVSWFVTFSKTRKANGWEAEKALRMFSAHLQDEADDWWNTYSTDNHGNNDAFRWPDIEAAFVTKFCTQRWQNKWLKDPEGRRHGPN